MLFYFATMLFCASGKRYENMSSTLRESYENILSNHTSIIQPFNNFVFMYYQLKLVNKFLCRTLCRRDVKHINELIKGIERVTGLLYVNISDRKKLMRYDEELTKVFEKINNKLNKTSYGKLCKVFIYLERNMQKYYTEVLQGSFYKNSRTFYFSYLVKIGKIFSEVDSSFFKDLESYDNCENFIKVMNLCEEEFGKNQQYENVPTGLIKETEEMNMSWDDIGKCLLEDSTQNLFLRRSLKRFNQKGDIFHIEREQNFCEYCDNKKQKKLTKVLKNVIL
ncbi:hypothetical protein H312_01902 [Anncaliia algerae PRA339]|uniref:Uncharacterized protein n=1 Tax=Anncaliia algerae PRA339 TaxID=1288291 RepID=A0A059F123_9MICR|nr:hypothetical protein H312_01902 [Anncaliia algerae PRA339]